MHVSLYQMLNIQKSYDAEGGGGQLESHKGSARVSVLQI